MNAKPHSPEWLIANADHGVAFERACASALERLLAENANLQQQLEAIGAGGVGPLIKPASSPEIPDSSNRGGQCPDMVTLPREVVEQVLNAFDCIHSPLLIREIIKIGAAKAKLRAALEQPPTTEQFSEVEQAAWHVADIRDGVLHWHVKNPSQALPLELLRGAHALYLGRPAVKDYLTDEQKQGEQEPVAWIRGSGLEMLKLENGGCATVYASDGMSNHSQPLYTHPLPKREPLTNSQINRLIADGKIPMSGNPYEVFRAAEAAHQIGVKS